MDLRIAVTLFCRVGILLLFVLGPLFFYAEPLGAQEGDRTVQADREKMEKRIDMMRKWRLMEEMNAGNEVYDRLFPLLAKYDDEGKSLQKEKTELIRELRQAIRQGRPAEDLLQKFVRIEARRAELAGQKMDELQRLLTPKQMATFIVVNDEFERDLRHMISKRDQQMRQMMMEHGRKMMEEGMGMGRDMMEKGMGMGRDMMEGEPGPGEEYQTAPLE